MVKLYHTSDLHLSFEEDGSIKKPMDKRSWSIGSSNYINYLDKLIDFQKNISSTDIQLITGDITHDMSKTKAIYSIKWVADNFNGIKVLCRGNHDRQWEPAFIRSVGINLPNMYILNNKEHIEIGEFLIACFDEIVVNKKQNERDWYSVNTDELMLYAQNISELAKKRGLNPILMCHYPVMPPQAEMLGNMGIKYYLSGHNHVTNGKMEGGIDLQWYNSAGGNTDDKYFNGCFFSTGTTDVLLVKHNIIVKELPLQHIQKIGFVRNIKDNVADMMKARSFLVKYFKKINPFNGDEIEGYINHEKGLMGGSIVINRVNGFDTLPQLIYGTPKLAYPYKEGTTQYCIPNEATYILANKWNGMNVLFYKYKTHENETRLCAKSKGTAVLGNSEHGNFLDLTITVLSRKPEIINTIMKSEYQSLSCELCGHLEPHLVKYDFDIDLKPLFEIYSDGRIKPYNPYLGHPDRTNNLISDCIISQKMNFDLNEQYRKENNLPLKYEFNHFITEGEVLYILDSEGYVVNRTLYKIKPKDIEEVHWQNFERDIKNRVNEAVKKCNEREIDINETNLREELDMGPKEWNKWRNDIKKYLQEERSNKLVILCGLPGSGKTTYCKELEKSGYVRVSQDVLGSANACKIFAINELKKGSNVVIDRTNITKRQRKRWTDLAKSVNIKNIECLYLDTGYDECVKRVLQRTGHETITDEIPNERKVEIVKSFQCEFEMPDESEGFTLKKV